MIMTSKAKIGSILFFVAALAGLAYLSINVGPEQDYKIEYIELEGNNYLTKEQYLQFTNLTEKKNYRDITLQIVKDRFEKHPYVLSADVKYDGFSKISVLIKEKKFESILLKDDTQYLLTEKLEVIPVLPGTRRIDYPVILNPAFDSRVNLFSNMKNNVDVLTASKIITAVKLLNPEMYDALSEVDLRNGADIVMFFSSFSYPVIIGRGDEIRKIVYFNSFWNNANINEINSYLDYVDLRFNKHIYLGIANDSLGRNKL